MMGKARKTQFCNGLGVRKHPEQKYPLVQASIRSMHINANKAREIRLHIRHFSTLTYGAKDERKKILTFS